MKVLVDEDDSKIKMRLPCRRPGRETRHTGKLLYYPRIMVCMRLILVGDAGGWDDCRRRANQRDRGQSTLLEKES